MHELIEIIWSRKLAFLGTFFLVFTLSYVVLVALDFLPEPVASEEEVQQQSEDESLEADLASEETIPEVEELTQTTGATTLPLQIKIAKLDRTVTVLNPTSRIIEDLDTALLEGAVRHPDSAALNQEGNVFILGHSSYLPNVFNKNFQAFNGIQDLAWGDIIEVYSDSSVYEYRVEKVYRANATEVTVPIAGEGHRLILATCNSFGSSDDRYIVEAKRVDVRGV